jgi:hypothetical protein
VKLAVLWVDTPCSLVKVTDVLEVLADSIITAMMIEAPSASEMSVNFYQTTWCINLEDSQLHTCCHGILMSRKRK